jgi:hypothetical protein
MGVVGIAAKAPPLKEGGSVTFAEVSFTLPGSGWETKAENQYFMQTGSPPRFRSINIWMVDPYLHSRFASVSDHVKAYFAFERNQARPPGYHWANFSETCRTVAGKSYPGLCFTITFSDLPAAIEKGVMLLLFPTNFDDSQRFYVLYWHEIQSQGGQAEIAWDDVDAMLASLSLKDHRSPGVLRGLQPAEVDVPALKGGTAKSLAVRFAKATRKASSYRTEFVCVDQSIPELENHAFVRLHWVMEYEKPDRHHVMQRGWPEVGKEYLYDEWMDLKEGHFDNAGFWLKAKKASDPTQYRSRLSSALQADRILHFLEAETPVSAQKKGMAGGDYWIFRYQVDPANDLLSLPIHYTTLVEAPYHLLLWVDATTGLLAKAEIQGKAMKGSGNPVSLILVQTFGLWGRSFAIKAPPVLN